MKSLRLLIKACFSGTAMRQLYERRRLILEKGLYQSRATFWVTLGLAVLIAGLLVGSSWVPQDMNSYMQTRSGIYQVPKSDYRWITSGIVDADCSLINDCRRVLSTPFLLKEVDLKEIDKTIPVGGTDLTMLVRLSLPIWTMENLRGEPTVVISLPRLRYKEAEMFVNDQHTHSFKRGERLFANLSSNDIFSKQAVTIDVVLRLSPSSRTIAGVRNNEGLFVASQSEFYRYRNYLISNSSKGVGKLGSVAKIVLALFCLLLFLIVDNSPESVGLGLFMGFEAMAIGIGQGWLPLGLFGLEHEKIWVNFCYQMGDLMKLYFLLQLTRIGPPAVMPWLVGGAMLSLPYGIFMEYAYQNDITWVYKIPRTRDTIVGVVGFLLCVQAIYSLRDKKIPWRITALAIGGFAAFTEVVNSWIAHSDLFRIDPSVKTIFTVFQAQTGYLFALSTFLNISTLENRVRVLTKERDSALEMKRQMELGQSVQRSFLAMPDLPAEIGIATHHEAAKYVSGDTYFVHYDQDRQSLTFLLNDVTGHGVQAALKAFASNMIAKTIWLDKENDGKPGIDRRKSVSRLSRFDKLVDDLICNTAKEDIPDFNAMIGAEFFLDRNYIEIYRANYAFPILLEPNFDWGEGVTGAMAPFWSIKSLAVPNREVFGKELKPGAIVALVSDGFIVNARDEASLIRHLYRFVENHPDRIDARKIQNAVVDWTKGEAFHAADDDRTILVFQWDPRQKEGYDRNQDPDETLAS